MAQEQQIILVPDYLTVRELAELVDESPVDVMKSLISNGIMASINQQVDYDTAAIVLGEMGYEVRSKSAVEEEEAERKREEERTRKWERMYAGEDRSDMVSRPPVITILGHVDHGKTTLLDGIRRANVAGGEAGGITQHIGAYQVEHNGRKITFLDTPGHEAFTEMRARGAQGADIAVLVVAADDGVMPTTREALNHARAANVPIVVAINKVDKANANPDLVKQQLAELDLIPDDWDGSTLMVPISALQGEGIEDLLEAVILEAEQYDILGNPDGTPRGIVVESEVDKYKGTLATLLVMNGTLHVGDTVIAGLSYGRIKAMYNERGEQIEDAGPSTPVEILGLNEPPGPGERFEVVDDDKIARRLVEDRANEREAAAAQPIQTASLEEIFAQFRAGQAKQLNLIVKADVQGSLEPIVTSLDQMSGQNEEGIQVKVLAADVGAVSENDVMLASAGDEESDKAIIIAFSTTVSGTAKQQAQQQGVEIRHYDVIYKLLEDVEKALQGMLDPKYSAKTIGRAEIRQLFTISRVGTVAGSYMRDGEARRKAKANVVRDGTRIAEGLEIDALKRFNEDVNEVRQGYEFGVSFVGYNDLQEGDTIEFYIMERVS